MKWMKNENGMKWNGMENNGNLFGGLFVGLFGGLFGGLFVVVFVGVFVGLLYLKLKFVLFIVFKIKI